eukprot:213452-Chlamydomonas_euryale.AAC.8
MHAWRHRLHARPHRLMHLCRACLATPADACVPCMHAVTCTAGSAVSSRSTSSSMSRCGMRRASARTHASGEWAGSRCAVSRLAHACKTAAAAVGSTWFPVREKAAERLHA